MQPPSSLQGIYGYFEAFISWSPNQPFFPSLDTLMGGVPANERKLIQTIFNTCAFAKSIPWTASEPAVLALRQTCQQKELYGYFHLISCVALSALFAGQCTSLQAHQLAEGFISDALLSSTCFSPAFLDRFSAEGLRLKIVTSLINCLASYPHIDRLENYQSGFKIIFSIWRRVLNLAATKMLPEPFFMFQAFLQFPMQYWDELDSKEKQFLATALNQNKMDLDCEGGDLGRRDLTMDLTSSPEEWSLRLAFLRKIASMYMLGRYLGLWSQGIDAIFPGFLHQLCLSASVYAGENRDVRSQLSFITRLKGCCEHTTLEYKVLDVLYCYFLHICQPPLSISSLEGYTFLINYDLLASGFPEAARAELHQRAEFTVIALQNLGIPTGIGLRNFLERFFGSTPPPPEAEIRLVFEHFAPAIQAEFQVCPVQLKERIIQAFSTIN